MSSFILAAPDLVWFVFAQKPVLIGEADYNVVVGHRRLVSFMYSVAYGVIHNLVLFFLFVCDIP